jgi:hypothetical protein
MPVSVRQSEYEPTDEPIGIVISRGGRDEVLPAFRAYVWGPAPETTEQPAAANAA